MVADGLQYGKSMIGEMPGRDCTAKFARESLLLGRNVEATPVSGSEGNLAAYTRALL